MNLESIQNIQNSQSSLFKVDEQTLIKFRQLVEQTEQISNIIERKSINNSHFYYLLRDVWIYFDAEMELELDVKTAYKESIIRYTFFDKLLQYVKDKKIEEGLLKKDFYTFLLAHFLAEGITNWLEDCVLANEEFMNLFKTLTKEVNVLATIEEVNKNLQKHEVQMIKHQIVKKMNHEFIHNEASLYEQLDVICAAYHLIIDTLHTIVSEPHFNSLSFKQQTVMLEDLYQNKNLFEIARFAKETYQFIKRSGIDSIATDASTIEEGIAQGELAPIVICPSQTLKLYPIRHYMNGVILAITSIAKKLKRHVFILPISKQMNQLMYFENGQFTVQDIVELGKQYVTAEQGDFQPVLNFSSLFLKQSLNIKNGRIILLSDEELLSKEEPNRVWQEAFTQFKQEQKVFVTCVLMYEELKMLQTSFVDQLVLVDLHQLMSNQLNVSSK